MSGVLVPVSSPLRLGHLCAPHGSWCRPETWGPLPVRDACSQSAAPAPSASKARTCPARGQAGCWRPACPEHTGAWKPPCPRGAGRGSPYTAALLWELQSPHPGRLLRALSPRGDTRGEPSWGQKRCLGSSCVESHCLIPSAQASSSLPSGGFIFSSPLPRGQGHTVVFLWQASLSFLLEMGRVVSAASWGVVKV